MTSLVDIAPSLMTPSLVLIPAGDCLIGGGEGDKFANSTEKPTVRVQFEAFEIGSSPVTVGEYRMFKPQHASEEEDGFPVVRVSWKDAFDYCSWLSQESGRCFRLPSEAEWEYACRAGTQTPFNTGHHLTLEDSNYLYDEAGTRVGRGGRTPIKSYPSNPWGLYDAHGNVCEWCADCWYPSHAGAPQNGSPRDFSGTQMRVIRGGGWDYLPRLLRSSWRDGLPFHTRRDNLGFRAACTLSQTS